MRTPHFLLRAFLPIATLGILACTPDGPLAPDAQSPIGIRAADDAAQGTLNCQVGTFETNGECVFAPIGYYMPFINFTFAFSCPLPFTTSGIGSTNVNQCIVVAPAGSFVSSDTHAITPCPAGQYQPFGGQDNCLAAPAGYYIPEPGADRGFDHQCSPGTYSVGGAVACSPALPGSFVSGFGQDHATLCVAGTYQPAEGQSSCLVALPGSYVPGSGSTLASACSAGSYSSFAGASSCTPAPAGTYVPGPGAAFVNPCAIGTYQPAMGQSVCLPAAIGTYVSSQGQQNATPCPAGTTTTAVGSTSSAQCVTRPLTLGDAKLWIGLKNSDDVGLRLDLRAEVLLNGVVVGSGDLQDVPGGSSGFNNAVLQTIALAMNGAVSMPPGAVLTFRPSVRRTCVGGGHNSGTVRFWYDGPAIDAGTTRNAGSRFAATVATVSSNFFMQDPAALLVTAGTTRQSVDVTVNSSAACPARPFSSLGEWSITQP